MKTATYLLALATFLVAPSLSATQSNAQSDGPAIVSGILASADELSPEVQWYVGRGDELTGRLRYDAAAREYARAAETARREGHLPQVEPSGVPDRGAGMLSTATAQKDVLIGEGMSGTLAITLAFAP